MCLPPEEMRIRGPSGDHPRWGSTGDQLEATERPTGRPAKGTLPFLGQLAPSISLHQLVEVQESASIKGLKLKNIMGAIHNPKKWRFTRFIMWHFHL